METTKYGIILSQNVYFVTKCSFRHNLTEATKQKTYLTKAVKEYELILEMPCRPLNMESFGHKMLIS